MNGSKILLLTDEMGPGGAERQLALLACGLKKHGCEVRLCKFYNGPNFYEDMLRPYAIETEYIPGAKSALKRPGVIARLVKTWKPDAVIAYKDGTCMSCCLAKLFTNFKLIVSERNTTQELSFRERIKFNLYRLADYVVPNSYSQKKYIDTHYATLSGKVKVITNALDTNKFKQRSERKDSSPSVIATTARIMPQKNVLTFLNAVKIIKENGADVIFRWYGYQNGPYFEDVMARRGQLGLSDIIEFLPPRKDVENVYNEADIYCLPSIYEGFPNVLCEAMACGLPVVASRVCDNPFIVEDGVNGFLFDPHNPADMAQKIIAVASMSAQERSNMGSLNNAKICKMCSIDKFTGQYLSLING